MSETNQRLNLTKLAGMPVRDPEGRRVGEIQELVLDPSQGSIQYATVALQSRTSDRLEVKVPWSQLRLAEECRYVELDISFAVLKRVASRRGMR